MCVTPNTRLIAWENRRVITTNNRYGQRRFPEAWHINMSNDALNWDTDISQHTPYQGFSVTGYIVNR
jgi:hypothetical protein